MVPVVLLDEFDNLVMLETIHVCHMIMGDMLEAFYNTFMELFVLYLIFI